MGNSCTTNATISKLDSERSVKVDNVNQKKVVLMYLLEKSYSLKTEDSRKIVNESLKEIFSTIKSETLSQTDFTEQKEFVKTLNNYQNMFDLLKIDCYGLLNCPNFLELSRKIVIEFYCSILLRDKAFVERYI
jgi:hypothetical protein